MVFGSSCLPYNDVFLLRESIHYQNLFMGSWIRISVFSFFFILQQRNICSCLLLIGLLVFL